MNTVLITGAGRHIGFHLARRMAELGWNVISTVHSMGRTEGQLPGTVLEMDVTDDGSVDKVAKQVQQLDVLINNAIYDPFSIRNDVLSVPIDWVRKTFEVNVLGALRVIQAFVPALIQSKQGRIVNVSSICGQIVGSAARAGNPMPAYSISKAALNMVTALMAPALKPKGIAVNSVCPSGPTTVEGAANEVVWAATELGQDQTGKFFHLRKPIDW